MSSGPSEIEPSEHEIELANVAAAKWERYKTHGRPLINEAIARATGHEIDPETGELSIREGGMLNPDGSVKSNDTAAVTASEVAHQGTLGRMNPNMVGAAETMEAPAAAQQADSSVSMRNNQQASYLRGLNNVSLMGKGMETEAIASQQQLASNAQNEAINSAFSNQQAQQANASAVGNIAGMAAAGMLRRHQNKPVNNKNPYPDGVGP